MTEPLCRNFPFWSVFEPPGVLAPTDKKFEILARQNIMSSDTVSKVS